MAPAESVAQRQFMAMLEHNPKMRKERGVKMSTDQLHDFAATKEKGLPEHVKPKKPMNFMRKDHKR